VVQRNRRDLFNYSAADDSFLYIPKALYQQLCQRRNKINNKSEVNDMINGLKFLGTGSAFNPVLGNTACYFVMGKKFFLLDCGASVFERLWYLAEFRDCEDIYAVITHLHNDHAGSLAALASACFYELKKKIHIIHPNKKIVEMMSLMGITQSEYFYHAEMPAWGVSFRAAPVEHVRDMASYGYIVKTNGWSFYYSGDARLIPDDVLEQFYKEEIGFIFQDTSVKGSSNHARLSYLEQVIPEEARGRVYCMHLEQESACGEILGKGFKIAGA
jgi:hypothetical protein